MREHLTAAAVDRLMKRAFTVAMMLAAPACAAIPGPPPPPYHATGTEPFWNLLIDEHDLTFVLAGEPPVREPAVKPIIGFAGEIYRSGRMDVNVVHTHCSDGMSDRAYPDRVDVRIGGQHYSGCGGL
jgi:uncharacterized membrane protein